MTRAQVPPAPINTPSRPHRRRSLIALPLTAMALAATACGGGDDETAATTTLPLSTTVAPQVTSPPATQPVVPVTTAPPTAVSYVTAGATVMVSNASRVDGGAGRLTDRLTAVGFQTVAPGNYSLGKLDVTKIYYDATNAAARAVADSLKAAFGGGAIEVLELPTPPPVDTADVAGAGVLVAMGNDIADKTLDELQGITPPATSAPPTSAGTATTAPPTTTA